MNVTRTEMDQGNGFVTVRFKIAMDKRVEVRVYPTNGHYSQAEVSISTATLYAEDMPAYISMLAQAYAEVNRMNATYHGKEIKPQE